MYEGWIFSEGGSGFVSYLYIFLKSMELNSIGWVGIGRKRRIR